MKLNNDAMSVQPCPVHGRKPELYKLTLYATPAPAYVLRCPVVGCVCEADPAPTRELAMEEWDAMSYGLSGREPTAEFPALEFFSGDDDQADPYEPENDDE